MCVGIYRQHKSLDVSMCVLYIYKQTCMILCIYKYVCRETCMIVYLCVHEYVSGCMYVCRQVCMTIHVICMYVDIHIAICMYVWMDGWMKADMYVWMDGLI